MAQALQARALPTKPAAVQRPQADSDLSVKFRDHLKVRAVNGDLTSLVGGDISAAQQLLQTLGVSFEQTIRLPQATLDSIEAAAAQASGVAQPDFAGSMTVTGPAANLQDAASALLALSEVEWVQFSTNDIAPGSCNDLVPTTPDYFGQGYQSYHGANPGLHMSCAWTYGGRGLGVRLADIEFAYRTLHEDRCVVNGPSFTCTNSEDHGTSVLGITVGLDNGYGITGLAPQANPYFFSALDQSNCDVSWPATVTAIAAATNPSVLRSGDVLLYELQPFIPGTPNGIPLETRYDIFLLTRSAVQRGVIVVELAGNGQADLDSTTVQGLIDWRSWGDSGAIIVSAGTDKEYPQPNGAYIGLHAALAVYSIGSRIDVQGWAAFIFTSGCNAAFYSGSCVDLDPADNLHRQIYTNSFSDTSGAAAMVAGTVLGLQSLRIAHHLPLYTSQQMRSLLKNTGWAQGTCNQSAYNHGLCRVGNIGKFPNAAKAILQMGIGATDCNANDVPDLCEGGGGCCIAGHCSIKTPACCSAQGGNFLGAGTKCYGDCTGNGIDDECETVQQGACCLSVSQCVPASECSCEGISFWGPGSSCATTNCHLAPE